MLKKMSPLTMRPEDFLVLFFVVVAFSFGEASLFILYRAPDIHNLGLATVGIFHGETHWRTFQNRLLGPALVVLVQKILCITRSSCEYDEALRVYYCVAMCVANLIFVFLAVAIRRDIIFGFVCLMCCIGFQITMWTYWYYPWDPVEISLFSILLLMDVKRERSLLFFYILASFWVFSKETVIFVPIWFLLTRGVVPTIGWSLREGWALNKRILVHASIMGIAAISIIKTLRDRMFTYSALPNVGTDEANRQFGDFFMLSANITTIKTQMLQLIHFHNTIGSYGSVYAITFMGLFLYAAVRFWKSIPALPPLVCRAFLFSVIYFGFVITAGNMIETRVYLPFAPMALMLYLLLNGEARQGPTSA